MKPTGDPVFVSYVDGVCNYNVIVNFYKRVLDPNILQGALKSKRIEEVKIINQSRNKHQTKKYKRKAKSNTFSQPVFQYLQ